MENLIKGTLTKTGVVAEFLRFLWGRKLRWLNTMVRSSHD